VLIISSDFFNKGPAQMVVVLPVTTVSRVLRWRVPIKPPEGGLRAKSFIICESVRSLSKLRLSRKFGSVSSGTMAEVEDRVRILLDLFPT
jgi:mRNA interferase MazF